MFLKRSQVNKRRDGGCFFCGEDRYELLDNHRILEGEHGGTYDWLNALTTCALCHRKVHAGLIKLGRKNLCTNGNYVINYWEGGEERWKECPARIFGETQ